MQQVHWETDSLTFSKNFLSFLETEDVFCLFIFSEKLEEKAGVMTVFSPLERNAHWQNSTTSISLQTKEGGESESNSGYFFQQCL
jgi:hypothetical protein